MTPGEIMAMDAGWGKQIVDSIVVQHSVDFEDGINEWMQNLEAVTKSHNFPFEAANLDVVVGRYWKVYERYNAHPVYRQETVAHVAGSTGG